jgi:Flp pilus assembly pilin Flp
MKNLKKFSRKLFKSESGQGATEYILLLVVVVGLVFVFKGRIKETFETKLTELTSSIGKITGD